MSEKLESIQKIILATGSIVYMASAINSVNEQTKFVTFQAPQISTVVNSIEDRDKLLRNATKMLGDVMEMLGDYMNGADCLSPVDENATEAAFRIVVHGEDDVEGY